MAREWEREKIENLLDFKNGLNKGKQFFGYGTPVVNYTDVYKRRGLKKADIKGKVSLSDNEIHRYEAKKGDVFFTRTSETPEEVGISSVLLEEISDCVFSGFLLRGRPKTNRLMPEYCKYCFSTREVRREIITRCTYTTRALTNGKQLSAIDIPVPEKLEQKMIAGALSDIDSLIEKLSLLIEKKKNILQGALQSILSGEQRLSGYSSAWNEFPLSKFGAFVRGVSYNPSIDIYPYENDFTLQLLRANNIVDSSLDMNDVVYVGRNVVSNKQILKYGDVIIAMSSGSAIAIGKSAQYKQNNDKYCIGAFCAIYRSDANDYLYYIFQSSMFREKLKESLEGSSINNLTGKALGKMVFPFPADKHEWNAISQILNDMNDDIAFLQGKLEKYKRIKIGMMDELLTGKIRLV